MNVVWSLPVRGESLSSTRGDLVRARSLIEALREKGHRVTVIEDGGSPAARKRVTAYRDMVRPWLPGPVATIPRDLGRVAHGRAHGRRVAAAAREEGAELIIETQVHFAGSGALASRLSGIPLLLDDCSPSTEEHALGATIPGLARHVFRTQARVAAALTASSVQIRDRIVDEGAPGDRVHIVPNGVELDAYRGADRTSARRELGLGDDVVICFVGSFQPWHRTELLLDAVRLMPEAGIRLLLIGDGPGRAPLLDRADALGLRDRILSPGTLSGSEMIAALVASDIGALPASNDYGQPMKLLDYAAAALPIVAADVPPVRDMIEPGVTGLLIPPGDPAALAAALTALARAPSGRSRLGRAGRTRLAACATWEACAGLLLRAAPTVRRPRAASTRTTPPAPAPLAPAPTGPQRAGTSPER